MLKQFQGEQGWRSGDSTHLPPPSVICGLSLLLVLILAPRVFLRVIQFSSLHTELLCGFSFINKSCRVGILYSRKTCAFLYFRSINYSINGYHVQHIVVLAEVVSVALELSNDEVVLSPSPGLLAESGKCLYHKILC